MFDRKTTVSHRCIKETEIALMKQEQANMRQKIDEIHAAVVGTEDRPGLKGRVGNIETSLDNTKLFGKLFAAAFTIILTVLAFLKGK